jgi:acetyl-CoA carboxylase biotin carboxyl carrier protein
MAKKKIAPRPRKAARGKSAPNLHGVDLEMIESLMRLMEERGVLELEVLSGPDRKVRLSRKPAESTPVMMHAVSHPPAHHAPAHHAPPQIPPYAVPSGPPAGTVEFCSPMVGTFYRASNPESPPYVVPGDKVSNESVICIIEAMKVMNEIKAEFAGEIVDVLVENGEAVEYGQPLFLIKKSN